MSHLIKFSFFCLHRKIKLKFWVGLFDLFGKWTCLESNYPECVPLAMDAKLLSFPQASSVLENCSQNRTRALLILFMPWKKDGKVDKFCQPLLDLQRKMLRKLRRQLDLKQEATARVSTSKENWSKPIFAPLMWCLPVMSHANNRSQNNSNSVKSHHIFSPNLP